MASQLEGPGRSILSAALRMSSPEFSMPVASNVDKAVESKPTAEEVGFPWATAKELETGSIKGKRVACGSRFQFSDMAETAVDIIKAVSEDKIGEAEDFCWVLDVISSAGSGKSGIVYDVVVADIQDYHRASSNRSVAVALDRCRDLIGDHLMLKIELPNAPEPLRHEVAIMKRKGASWDVPYTTILLAQSVGTLGSPRTHPAVLMTVAPGVPLSTADVTPEEREVIEEQLKCFARGMLEKHLLHADVCVSNILWDRDSKQTTVIDFGNAVDLDHVETQKEKLNVQNKKDEGFEIDQFLNRKWQEQCEHIRVSESTSNGGDELDMFMMGTM